MEKQTDGQGSLGNHLEGRQHVGVYADDIDDSVVRIGHPIVSEANAALVMFGLLHSFVEIAEKFPALVSKVDCYIRGDAYGHLMTAVQDPSEPPDGYLHVLKIPGTCHQWLSLEAHEIPDDLKDSIERYLRRYPDANISHEIIDVREIASTRRAVPIERPSSDIPMTTGM